MLRTPVPHLVPGHTVSGGRLRTGCVIHDHGLRAESLHRAREQSYRSGHAAVADNRPWVVLDDPHRELNGRHLVHRAILRKNARMELPGEVRVVDDVAASFAALVAERQPKSIALSGAWLAATATPRCEG